MKRIHLSKQILPALTGLAILSAQAGEPIDYTSSAKNVDVHNTLWDPHRVDSHAPISVMGEHTHEAGEWMVSYRYMSMEMGENRDGTNTLASQQLFNLGFPVATTEMTMEMHMMGLMYAPTDTVTLMAMTGYEFNKMDHVTRPGSPARMMRGETFKMATEGWGDTQFGALVKFHDANKRRAHLNLMMSAPTGNLTEKAYPMHTGTGTWDLLPGVTYLWQEGNISGGSQLTGRVHLGDNDLRFAYGDSVEGTSWLAYRLTDYLSVSGRLSLEHTADIDGVDARLTAPFMAPPQDAANHGGTWAEAGLGLNVLVGGGNRVAFEAVMPFYQDLNGPQMERDVMFTAGWQKAF
ncbi:MAG: hypothetical protein P1U81_13185 [Verrucomicrobiales bacterium]|jgi:hypothetical protein|nr:hypothetical protein [Verrucomicrobiales bacterium]